MCTGENRAMQLKILCPIIAPCTFPISFNTFPIDHQVSSRSWKMLIAADWLVMLITADDAGIFCYIFTIFYP